MATYRFNRLVDPQSQVGGTTATGEINIGATLHQLLFKVASTTADASFINTSSRVRVKANGIILLDFPSTAFISRYCRFDRNAVQVANYNTATETVEMVINLDRAGLLTRAGRELTAIGSGIDTSSQNGVRPITTLTYEIDLPSSWTGSIEAYGNFSAPAGNSQSKAIRNLSYNIGGAGTEYINNFYSQRDISRIFLDSPSTANQQIERVVLKADNTIIFERDRQTNYYMQNIYLRTNDAGATGAGAMGSLDATDDWFVIDPAEWGYGDLTINTQRLGQQNGSVVRLGDINLVMEVTYPSGTTSHTLPVVIEEFAIPGN